MELYDGRGEKHIHCLSKYTKLPIHDDIGGNVTRKKAKLLLSNDARLDEEI